MPTPLPTVSVIIPTAGNKPGGLEVLLRPILADIACRELIVVLDHESPGTRAAIQRVAELDDRIKLLEIRAPAHPERDRGQASRDVGFREARSEVILSLDDDLEPMPGLVKGHAQRHAQRAGLVVQGYTPVAAIDAKPGESQTATELYSEHYEQACVGFRNGSPVLLGLWGGHFSIRREAWLKTEKLFGDPPLGSVQEAAFHIDRALGLRFRAAGLEGVFDPALVAVHHHPRRYIRILDHSRSAGRRDACIYLAYPELASSPSELVSRRRAGRLARKIEGSRALSRPVIWCLDAAMRSAGALRWRAGERLSIRALSLLGYTGGARESLADRGGPAQ